MIDKVQSLTFSISPIRFAGLELRFLAPLEGVNVWHLRLDRPGLLIFGV